MLPLNRFNPNNTRPSLFDSIVHSISASIGPQETNDTSGEPNGWPEVYVNSDTGKVYKPHHQEEADFVFQNTPRYGLCKGGEGSGKSSASTIKTLERLRHGMSGILVSPDFEHFKKSMWEEFRRWCPPLAVVPRERYRLESTWEPSKPFALHFRAENGIIATLYCGGIEDPTGWEGPNVSFAHFDEARRHNDAGALKVLDGRVRIPGPKGEPPQLYISTTPRKNWLFEYFGPLLENTDDPFESFKRDSRVVTLLTEDNEAAGNLSAGYTKQRAQTLTSAEERVYLRAEWEDVDDATRFLGSIIWWDNLKEDSVTLAMNAPMVFVADAGVVNDTFGLVGVGRHPRIPNVLQVGYARAWVPKGIALDFDEIETEIRELAKTRNILKLGYDPFQLHQMMTRLQKDRTVETVSFGQGAARSIADKQLLDMILQRQLRHDGNTELRQHIDNADKKTAHNRSIRLVKRSDGLKIDLAVALSMCCNLAAAEFFGKSTLGTGFMQGGARRKQAGW